MQKIYLLYRHHEVWQQQQQSAIAVDDGGAFGERETLKKLVKLNVVSSSVVTVVGLEN